MHDNDHSAVALPMIKIISAWAAAIGLQTWGDLASFLAACYTLLLIAEWIYHKFIRPIKDHHDTH